MKTDIPPVINFKELSVSYGRHTVINGVSGSLYTGCFAALIGPNGGGKSTFIKALGGLLTYRGSVILNGRETASMPRKELARAVGILPQKLHIEDSLTVYDLVALGRLPFEGFFTGRSASDEEKILESAALLQLDELLFANASKISGGEAQRSLLAMLLAQDPGVFLLDEPNSAMDVKHSIAVFSLFRRMAERGRIVLAAVHDVNLALQFAHEVIALKDGKIHAWKKASDVDGEMLESLYETGFERYSSEGGKTVWHAVKNRL